MRRVALLRDLDQLVKRLSGVRLRGLGFDLRVLEPHRQVVGPVARGDYPSRLLLEVFEIDIPDPRHVGAVGFSVVETDKKARAVRQVDRSAQRFVEAGWILGENEV